MGEQLQNYLRDLRWPVAVVLHVGGLGDRLLTVPVIRALSSVFPKRLTIVCDSVWYKDIYGELGPKELIELAKVQPPDEDIENLAAQLSGCDGLICFDRVDAHTSEFLARSLAPVYTVGFWPWAEHQVTYDSSNPPHMADILFALARKILPTLRIAEYYRPSFSAHLIERAKEIRRMLPPEAKLLAVHADTKPYKMFCLDSLRRGLDDFLGQHGEYVVFLLGWEDVGIGNISNADQVVSCLRLPFPLQCCLVGMADQFLGLDSCYLHAADLFRVPGVGIFGPTDPSQWGFRFSESIHLRHSTLTPVTPTHIREALEDLDRRTCRRSYD